MDIGKNFFTERAVKHWSRLPRGVVEAPCRAVSERRVDAELRVMVSGGTDSAR